MFRVNVGGVQATIQAMRLIRTTEQDVRDRVVEAAGAELLKFTRLTGGISDGHGQRALDALDNPYATRHGAINEAALGHTGWWVHNQTGRLLKSLQGRVVSPGVYEITPDASVAPHAHAVIHGTRVMFARDFIWITANLRPVRIEMMRAMVRVLGKEMRTKAHVRFTGGMGVLTSNSNIKGGGGLPPGAI